ncbi:MAG TPA: BT_3928 family protein [Phnomibacter sp.]|nr:BT_3928 family protein [Phnomibacter sp.]
MKSLVQIFRVITGVLFIFSGLIKANDPLGLAYKMDEYFAVWNWHWASQYSLGLSIGMNIFEIVAGIALLLGWAPKLVSKLLLVLIVFFSFLTGYAVITGQPKTCGCFGDCVPLLPWHSFLKDMILLVMVLVLYVQSKHIKGWLPLRANLFLVLFSIGFVFFGQLHVLKHLPFVDCLPYAAGKNLLQQMQPPPGSVPDSVAIFYTYEKEGKQVSFDATHFPEDFNDSLYTYINREEKIVRKGNAEPAIKDLAFYSSTSADTTKAVLETKGKYLLFFAKDFAGTQPEWQEIFVKVFLKANEKKLPMFIVSNQPQLAGQWFSKTNHFNLPILTCDGTVMKTMLRSNTGIVGMEGAKVAAKWSETDMNEAVKWIKE